MLGDCIGIAVLLWAYLVLTSLTGLVLGAAPSLTLSVSAVVLLGGMAVLLAIGGIVQLLGRRAERARG